MIGQVARASFFQAAGNTPAPVTQAAEQPIAAPEKTEAAQFVEQLRRLGGRGTDVTKIPFKIICEVKGDQSGMSRLLGATGWDVGALKGNNHNSGGDCSHGGDGGGSSYVRLLSPQLTLGGGGLDSIAAVLDKLRQHGSQVGNTAAMRFLVSSDQLGDDATSNFVGVHLSNEDILYRLGQAGGAGRAIGHKQGFASPPSSHVGGFRQRSAADWQQNLKLRNGGLNSYTKGWWELRYFDSTLDTAALQSTACLVVGMTAAAIDGRTGYSETNKAAQYDKEVDRVRWARLMDATVGEGPLRTRLEQQFISSGGTIAEPLNEAAQQSAKALLSRGYQLVHKGRAVTGPTELQNAFSGTEKSTLVTPRGRRIELDVEGFRHFLVGENGLEGTVPDNVHVAHGQAHHLSWKASLRDISGLEMTPFEAAYEVAHGGACLARAGEFAVKLSQNPQPGDGISFEKALAIPGEDWAALGQMNPQLDAAIDSPAVAGHWLQMRRGCTFEVHGTQRFGAVAGEGASMRFPSGLEMSLPPDDLIRVARADKDAAAADPACARLLEAATQAGGIGVQIAVSEGGESATKAEMLAAALGGRTLHITDPLGRTSQAEGAEGLLGTVGDLSRAAQLDGAQQQTANDFGQLLGERYAAHAGDVSLNSAQQLPFALQGEQTIRLHETGASPRPEVGVEVGDWGRLREVLDVETAPAGAIPVLDMADALKAKGVQFYYVKPDKPVKMEMRSALAERLPEEGIKVRLPGLKLWHGWPRRKITLHGEHDMQRLAHKLKVAQ